MALREPIFYPDADLAEPPPQTEAALDGPGHGPGSRPPTTGMLPHGGRAEGQARVLLAADTERDRALLGVALLHAKRDADTAIESVYCSLAEAPLRVPILQPTLIVIEDRAGWFQASGAVTLCRFLRNSLPRHTTVIVLSNGPRLFRKRALHTAGADIVLPTSIREPALAAVLQASLAFGPETGRP
jgi:hypothetical protein